MTKRRFKQKKSLSFTFQNISLMKVFQTTLNAILYYVLVSKTFNDLQQSNPAYYLGLLTLKLWTWQVTWFQFITFTSNRHHLHVRDFLRDLLRYTYHKRSWQTTFQLHPGSVWTLPTVFYAIILFLTCSSVTTLVALIASSSAPYKRWRNNSYPSFCLTFGISETIWLIIFAYKSPIRFWSRTHPVVTNVLFYVSFCLLWFRFLLRSGKTHSWLYAELPEYPNRCRSIIWSVQCITDGLIFFAPPAFPRRHIVTISVWYQ